MHMARSNIRHMHLTGQIGHIHMTDWCTRSYAYDQDVSNIFEQFGIAIWIWPHCNDDFRKIKSVSSIGHIHMTKSSFSNLFETSWSYAFDQCTSQSYGYDQFGRFNAYD